MKKIWENIYWGIYSFICALFARQRAITRLIKEQNELEKELRKEKNFSTEVLQERNDALTEYNKLYKEHKKLKEDYIKVFEEYYNFVRTIRERNNF